MIANREPEPMSVAEYLAWERQQTLRYEYSEGRVYAMTGGTTGHNRLALNLNNAIESHLNATGHEDCQTFIADVKVAITLEGPFLYPDFILTCDDRDRDAIQFIAHPKLIGEVLSPSTEIYDRGAKFRQYRKLDTLQEYVLLASEQVIAEVFTRQGEDWLYRAYEPGSAIILESLNLSIPLEQLYRQVRFSC